MIQAVHKAALLLEVLAARYPDSVLLQELSDKTGIEKSTCIHILNTLIEDKLAERLGRARYSLGIGCFHLTRSGRFDKERLAICRPVLRWLRDKTDATAMIAEIRNGTKYTVEYFEGGKPILGSDHDILEDDIYRTATGRMILAHMSERDKQDVVWRHGLPKAPQWKNFADFAALDHALAYIRNSPWITVWNRGEKGYYIGYAMPLYDGKTVFGALGLATLKSECIPADSEEEKRLVRFLTRAANEINRRLKFDT